MRSESVGVFLWVYRYAGIRGTSRVTDWVAVGVDWADGGWIAVGYSATGTWHVDTYADIKPLWTEHGETAKRVLVDIPIGLCDGTTKTGTGCQERDDELSRQCDDRARDVLGNRYPTVFTPPCREAVEQAAAGKPYAEVAGTNEAITGKGLTKQALNLADPIWDVERFLLNEVDDREALLESHPEVCFRALADSPLQYSKHTALGVDERLAILEETSEYEQGDWRQLTPQLQHTQRTVGIDDLLDALALTITAHAPEEEFHALPDTHHPPRDSRGLPMQIHYHGTLPSPQ